MKKLLIKYDFKFSPINYSLNVGAITYNMLNVFLTYSQEFLKNDSDYIYLKNLYDNYYIDKVYRIEDTISHTYCLEMPDTHKFIQNGILAGNSQGSQSPIVIGCLDMGHYLNLKRNLLYTMMTRAQDRLYLIVERKAIDLAIWNNSIVKKRTNLEIFLSKTIK
jgi:hypothetical protein